MDVVFASSKEFKNICSFAKNNQLSLQDIELFISVLLKNAASRLNLDYTTLCKHFELQNVDFFKFKDIHFLKYEFMDITSSDFEKMCDLIKLPIDKKAERNNIKMNVTESKKNYTSDDCVKLFNLLSIEEKIKFIKEFNNLSLTLTTSDISNLLK